MNREKWLFKFQVVKVFDAALRKIKIHEERLAFWTKKKDEVFAKIKSEGLEIHTSLTAEYGSHSNRLSGRGINISVDDGLRKDLDDCQERVNTHAEKLRQYKVWEHVLAGRSTDELELDYNDFMFFFGDMQSQPDDQL